MSADLSTTTGARRAAMVERLEADGVLTDVRLREALLSVPREVLLPHVYVRVSDPGVEPIEWCLLDGAHPDDRAEWLDLIHSGESVLLQRDGEPLDALVRGLFHATADAYGRHHPGLPDEAVHLLAGTLRGIRRPALLDLGTGTGQVPAALLPVLPQLARLDLVDADRGMLHQAELALRLFSRAGPPPSIPSGPRSSPRPRRGTGLISSPARGPFTPFSELSVE
jgi:hypothetical protein